MNNPNEKEQEETVMRYCRVKEVMSSEVVSTRCDAPFKEVARLLAEHRISGLPVVDDEDRLVGIVTRGDLLQVFLRADDEIRRDVVNQVSRGIGCPRYTVDVAVDDGEVTLKGHLDRRSDAVLAVRITEQVDGIVSVTDRLTYHLDDSRPPRPAVGPSGHV